MKRDILQLGINVCEYIKSNMVDEELPLLDNLSKKFVERYNNIVDEKRNKYIERTGDIAGSLKYGYTQSKTQYWETKHANRGRINNKCCVVFSRVLYFCVYFIWLLVAFTSIFRCDANSDNKI